MDHGTIRHLIQKQTKLLAEKRRIEKELKDIDEKIERWARVM